MCASFKCFGCQLFASLQYQVRQWGGEGGGVAGRQLGRNAAFACPNICGGNLVLLFVSVKILSKTLLMAKSDVKT